MPKPRRSAAAAALLLASLAAAGPAAFAQESSNTVGPPQLKDFQLPGQRTTPPAERPTPAPPPPATTATQPPARTDPPPERRPDARTAAPTTTQREAIGPVTAPIPGLAPEVLTDVPATQAPLPETNATPPPTPALPDSATAPPIVADQDEGSGWRWPALAAAAALLAGLAFALLKRRRRRGEARIEQARDAARDELGTALVADGDRPAPIPVRAPVPEPEVAAAAEERRAWIEIDIKPERAAATDSETSVHYALTMRNRGRDVARNIRIDARLFNASAEDEVGAFFQGPIHEQSGSPQVTIAPDRSLTLMGQVAMPKAEALEIELNGLRIFVPMIAINVAYDWAGGSGRTSRSWILGRETQAAEKMGPFRLDLGPRIYRSVGRREAKLAMV